METRTTAGEETRDLAHSGRRDCCWREDVLSLFCILTGLFFKHFLALKEWQVQTIQAALEKRNSLVRGLARVCAFRSHP
jgi:hypothetical protein